MRRRDERGAIAAWASIAIVAFVIIVGAGVDFAGHARTEQRARAVAAEAARSGGQYLVVGTGLRPRADVGRAVAAAENYAAASEFSASTTVEAGVIRVTVQGAHVTAFLGIIGIDSLPVSATAAASVTTVVGGEVR